jgi:hypothetical protein
VKCQTTRARTPRALDTAQKIANRSNSSRESGNSTMQEEKSLVVAMIPLWLIEASVFATQVTSKKDILDADIVSINVVTGSRSA